MRESREHFAPFMEENFDDYITDLARDGQYAGNDAIVAFSRCYGVHVVIHQLNEPRLEVHTPSASATTKTVHIAYLNGEHYCSVQSLPQDSSALPKVSEIPGKGEGNAPTSKKASKSTSLSPAEMVIVATGCEDMELVDQCLRENDYDTDLALVEVLQLMSLGNDDTPAAPVQQHLVCDPHLPMHGPVLKTSAHLPPSPSGGSLKPPSISKPLTTELANSSKKPPKHAPPQHQQRHLTNRERKEQAKAARKQRRICKRKDAQPKQCDTATVLDPVSSAVIIIL